MANGTGITLTGKVNNVGETVELGSFSKRAVWLEIDLDSQYPQVVEIEFLKDKTSLLNPVKAGATVTIDVNLRGKLFTNDNGTRCYNTLNGWRLKIDSEPKSSGGTKSSAPATDAPQTNDDDLPF